MSSIKEGSEVIIIGISGVTCGGKTTTATELNKILPNGKIYNQDDYYFEVDDPRHLWIPELNHINFDVISSLDMPKMHQDILNYIQQHNFKRVNSSTKQRCNSNGLNLIDLRKCTYEKFAKSNVHVLIIDGFSIFNYQPMLNLFDLKYYFTLEKEECFKRRLTRVYEPPDVPGYFEKCAWPEHLNQLEEVRNSVENVTYIKEGNIVDTVSKILNDVAQYL